ncbi:LysR family transcriptional regulator [Teichococcus aerophilus]|nr:LysR family transcriptional regulator [Pseudoroseomonas aerophila]
MHRMNSLQSVDLNLLVVLEALLAERHVSRAATRLNKSQPAVSHALGRLRALLGDPLLVRRAGQLQPTARALELAPQLSEALHRMRQLLGPSRFDPATARRVFRLAMSDYGSAVLLPGLMRRLRRQAPGIDLMISQTGREGMLSQVMEGEIDLALAVCPDAPQGLHCQTLFQEEFVCVADAATPAAVELEAYLARPHASVALRPDMPKEVDLALAAIGRSRHVALVLPHWGPATRVVAGTDLVLTVARRILPARPEAEGLRVFPPPFAIPGFAFQQVWHPRRDGDAAHRWLREAIMELGAEL